MKNESLQGRVESPAKVSPTAAKSGACLYAQSQVVPGAMSGADLTVARARRLVLAPLRGLASAKAHRAMQAALRAAEQAVWDASGGDFLRSFQNN